MRPNHSILELLARLAGKGVAFFFILSLLLLCMYLLGNFQDFLDSSQLFLLRGLEVALLLEVAFSALYLAALLAQALSAGRFRFLRVSLSSLALLFGFGLLLGLKFLAAWFQL